MHKGTHARALHHAAELLGGTSVLARRLGVFPAAVSGWIDGSDTPSEAVFLQVVEILLGHDGRPR